MEKLELLVQELASLPSETEWVEFKENNAKPEAIGETISALANAATLQDRERAYMVWGVDDKNHVVCGSTFRYRQKKVGNEELESWLRRLLSENACFEFHETSVAGKLCTVLVVQQALHRPVFFKKCSYIRVGSYTKPLNCYPALEDDVWMKSRMIRFETQIAEKDMALAAVFDALNYRPYFTMLGKQTPEEQEQVAFYFIEEGLLRRQDNGLYAITSLGALLFARDLQRFPSVARKALRLVRYHRSDRLSLRDDRVFSKGYACIFEDFIQDLMGMVPSFQELDEPLRQLDYAFPPLAVRESISNALIHQDLSVMGAGPVVELFPERLEVSNPGVPLVKVERIIDSPPKSRNEKMASLMRRLRMCEELGTGWDKIALSCELAQLPAPRIDEYEHGAKVTLYSKVEFSQLSREDRLRACYFHACLKYIHGESLTNSSLRERLGLPHSRQAQTSRIIREAVEANLIKVVDATTSPRYMSYIPFWA